MAQPSYKAIGRVKSKKNRFIDQYGEKLLPSQKCLQKVEIVPRFFFQLDLPLFGLLANSKKLTIFTRLIL